MIFIKMMTSILGVAVNWMEYNELREEDTASAHLLLSLCEVRMFASAFQFVERLCDVLRTPHRQPGPPESLAVNFLYKSACGFGNAKLLSCESSTLNQLLLCSTINLVALLSELGL